MLRGSLPANWDADITFAADAKGMATRVASGKVMNALAPRAGFIGGSADLDPDVYGLEGIGGLRAAGRERQRSPGLGGRRLSSSGRNLHFGVREPAWARF